MTHALFILDFFMLFHCFRWSDVFPQCNIEKTSNIVYANVQGITQIKEELKDKIVMKANDKSIKPVLLNSTTVSQQDLDEIKYRYTKNKPFIDSMQQKIKEFEVYEKLNSQMQERNKVIQSQGKKFNNK